MKSVWPYNRIAVNKSTWIVSGIPKCRSTILSFRWAHFRSRSTKATRSNRWNWKFWVWSSEYVFRPVFRQKRENNLKHHWTSWRRKKIRKYQEITWKVAIFSFRIPKPVNFEDIYLISCIHTKQTMFFRQYSIYYNPETLFEYSWNDIYCWFCSPLLFFFYSKTLHNTLTDKIVSIFSWKPIGSTAFMTAIPAK